MTRNTFLIMLLVSVIPTPTCLAQDNPPKPQPPLRDHIFATADVSGIQQESEIKAIGCFANVRSDGEHAYGYSVRLWAYGREIIGMIDYHRGLLGDPPMGFLTDVQYDSMTGKISFEAKLTNGLHYCSAHKGVPSHDLLSFQGLLKADSLEGNIVLEEKSDSLPVVEDKRENFLMSRDDNCQLESYQRYEIWWWYWEPTYKSRGPEW